MTALPIFSDKQLFLDDYVIESPGGRIEKAEPAAQGSR